MRASLGEKWTLVGHDGRPFLEPTTDLQESSTEDLPIVMVTTQDEGEDKDTAYASGVTTILQKPFTEDQIGATLTDILGS